MQLQLAVLQGQLILFFFRLSCLLTIYHAVYVEHHQQPKHGLRHVQKQGIVSVSVESARIICLNTVLRLPRLLPGCVPDWHNPCGGWQLQPSVHCPHHPGYCSDGRVDGQHRRNDDEHNTADILLPTERGELLHCGHDDGMLVSVKLQQVWLQHGNRPECGLHPMQKRPLPLRQRLSGHMPEWHNSSGSGKFQPRVSHSDYLASNHHNDDLDDHNRSAHVHAKCHRCAPPGSHLDPVLLRLAMLFVSSRASHVGARGIHSCLLRCNYNQSTSQPGNCTVSKIALTHDLGLTIAPQLCKNSYYLWQGACIGACPSGTTGVGTGKFSRYCTPMRRRDAQTWSTPLGRQLQLSPWAGAASVFALVAVVVGMLAVRRQRARRITHAEP